MSKSYEELKELLYKKDGAWHTNCTDVLEGFEEVTDFFNVVKDVVNDGEVIHVYDDLSTDESCIFLFYKSGKEFLSQYITYDNGKYVLPTDNITWSSGLRNYLNGKEIAEFVFAVRRYIETSNLPIKLVLTKQQERFIAHPTEPDNLSIDQQEKIKSMSSFVKTILLLLCFIPAVIVAGITKKTDITFIAVGVGVIIYSIYFAIGILCKFRHVFCVLQSINKMPMTPNEVNWDLLTTSEKWMRPITYAVIGVIIILLAIFL
jgi:hypothetical protein